MNDSSATAIRETLTHIAREELGFKSPLPNGDLSEHLDSIQRLSFVVAIEDHYEIAFEPEDDEQAKTIEDVILIIHQKIS